MQQFCSPASERPGALMVEIHLTNRGTLAAEEVTLTSTLPAGFGLHATAPPAARNREQLTWSLGTIAPGEVRIMRMILDMHEPMAELRHAFNVQFQVREQQTWVAPIQRAVVLVTVEPPAQARVGAPATIQLTLRNIGNVAAEDLRLSALLPAGLTHPFGQQLYNALGTLEPGSSRPIALKVTPAQPGSFQVVIRVEGQEINTQTCEVRFHAQGPKLVLEPSGPASCALRTRAKCLLNLTCEEPTALGSLRVVAQLPEGLAFIGTEGAGQYDPHTHTVEWPGTASLKDGKPLSLEVVGQTVGEQPVLFTVLEGRQPRAEARWPLCVNRPDPTAR